DYFTDDHTFGTNMRWSANTPGVIRLQINSNGDVTATCSEEGWTGTEIVSIKATDEHGLTTSYPLSYTITDETSVDSISVNYIRVFPNPASDMFTVSFETTSSDEYSIQLLSPNGSILFNEKTSVFGVYSQRFNAHKLAKGIYTIIISNTSEIIYSKQIIIY
ncbi:MAG: T9SS type A sorting domain-containing protein, partial [Bacteroidales bacterium]